MDGIEPVRALFVLLYEITLFIQYLRLLHPVDRLHNPLGSQGAVGLHFMPETAQDGTENLLIGKQNSPQNHAHHRRHLRTVHQSKQQQRRKNKQLGKKLQKRKQQVIGTVHVAHNMPHHHRRTGIQIKFIGPPHIILKQIPGRIILTVINKTVLRIIHKIQIYILYHKNHTQHHSQHNQEPVRAFQIHKIIKEPQVFLLKDTLRLHGNVNKRNQQRSPRRFQSGAHQHHHKHYRQPLFLSPRQYRNHSFYQAHIHTYPSYPSRSGTVLLPPRFPRIPCRALRIPTRNGTTNLSYTLTNP